VRPTRTLTAGILSVVLLAGCSESEIPVRSRVTVTESVFVTVTEPRSADAPEVEATPPAGEAAQPVSPAGDYLYNQSVGDLPAGSAGEVAIIARGVPDKYGTVQVVVRNNTGAPVSQIGLTGVAYDASGAIVGSGEDHGFNPGYVADGEISMGYLYFGSDTVKPDSDVDITVDSESGDDDFGLYVRNLVISDVNVTGTAVLGRLTNPHDVAVSGPISVDLVCFDAEGTPIDMHQTYADADEVDPGGQATFSIDFSDPGPCESFLMAASGYGR